MAVVLYIKWSMEGEISNHEVIEVSENERQKLIQRNQGNPTPKYCDVSQAFKYGLQVDQIKVDEPKVKKIAIKSETVEVEKEVFEAEEMPEPEVIQEKKPKVILAKSEIK